MNKVLVCLQHPYISGGVVNHFNSLFNFFPSNYTRFNYGRRKSRLHNVVVLFDVLRFWLKARQHDCIVLNLSFQFWPLIRDGVLILCSRAIRKKVIVFFHGWDDGLYKSIEESPWIFRKVYNKTQLILTLGNVFERKLKDLGITTQIKLTSTKVDDELIAYSAGGSRNSVGTILFLARIIEEKGLQYLIQAVTDVSLCGLQVEVVGDGPYLIEMKHLCQKKGLNNVRFHGHINCKQKLGEIFNGSDVYVLPTSHGEGMPTSLLEAASFGLVPIVSSVGGIGQLFDDGLKGYRLGEISSEEVGKGIIFLHSHPEVFRRYSESNLKWGKRFYASKVAENLIQTLNYI